MNVTALSVPSTMADLKADPGEKNPSSFSVKAF